MLRGIALSPDEKRLYVTEFYTGVLHAIDRESGKVVDSWKGHSTDNLARHTGNFMAGEGTQLLHLAALTHGVFMGPGGEIALSSVVADETLEQARAGLLAALGDVARLTDNQ